MKERKQLSPSNVLDGGQIEISFTPFSHELPLANFVSRKGRLTNWTKGFKCSGVEGEDVVQLLKEALNRKGDVNIDVCAILNDTTGCLMSCAWKEPKCRIGLIVGTGTNACYLEDIDNVGTWREEDEDVQSTSGSGSEPRHVIINTEWGAFGDHGELDFIRTKWDAAIDEGSLNPGKQTFEKMVSGMYMGELTRQVLIDMIWEGLIFKDKQTDTLFEWGRFYTKYVSEIESDPVGDFTRTRTVLEELNIKNPSVEDMSAMRYICELVSRRAGFMVSAGITGLLKKMDYHDVVVAIDGSVFRLILSMTSPLPLPFITDITHTSKTSCSLASPSSWGSTTSST